MKTDRALEESYRFCGALSRREARNFYYAFLLLPRSRRRSMCALYAFMRHTDDLADEPGTTEAKAHALDAWRQALDTALAGRCGNAWPGHPALKDTVERHGIPAQLLHEVIEGVSMDIQPRGFATFADLADYCYHVASVVGLSCLHIWGYRSEGGLAERLAEHCGIALQLTNILRDVGDDARNGRIYLPGDDLARFGVKPEELAVTVSPVVGSASYWPSRHDRAYEYYEDARPLVRLVNPVGRPVLRTIVGIYRSLLDEIAGDYQVLDGRISLPPGKIAIALERWRVECWRGEI